MQMPGNIQTEVLEALSGRVSIMNFLKILTADTEFSPCASKFFCLIGWFSDVLNSVALFLIFENSVIEIEEGHL